MDLREWFKRKQQSKNNDTILFENKRSLLRSTSRDAFYNSARQKPGQVVCYCFLFFRRYQNTIEA